MNVRVVPHKRGGGKWAVDYRCPVTKKRKYESFPSKREATSRKRKLEGEYEAGKYRPLHTIQWADFVTEYKEKVQAGKKPKTKALESRAIETFERHCKPGPLRLISTKVIDEFRAKRSNDQGRKGKKVSSYTVCKEMKVIRLLLRKAREWNYITDVPRFHFPRTVEPEPRAIPIAEFNSILALFAEWDKNVDRRPAGWKKGAKAADDRTRGVRVKAPGIDWWRPFLSTSYFAGLRLGELLNLRWKDCRFTASPDIRIWNEKCSRWDYVPMSATLAERLQVWMGESSTVSDKDLVFPHRCHDRTLSSTWTKVHERAGMEPYRLHDLRVSFCTNLVAAGVAAPQLKKLARHRSIETTMKYYRGRTEEADRRALHQMEAAFSIDENQSSEMKEVENVLANEFSTSENQATKIV